MSAFIRSIGLNTDGWTIKEVKEQLRRLSSSKLSLGFTDGARGFQYDLQIINAFDLGFPKMISSVFYGHQLFSYQKNILLV
jgi:hypothetical protein